MPLHIFRNRMSNSLREFDVLLLGDFLDTLPLFGREIDVDSDVAHTIIIHQFNGALPTNFTKTLDRFGQPWYDGLMNVTFEWLYAKFRKLVVSE